MTLEERNRNVKKALLGIKIVDGVKREAAAARREHAHVQSVFDLPMYWDRIRDPSLHKGGVAFDVPYHDNDGFSDAWREVDRGQLADRLRDRYVQKGRRVKYNGTMISPQANLGVHGHPVRKMLNDFGHHNKISFEPSVNPYGPQFDHHYHHPIPDLPLQLGAKRARASAADAKSAKASVAAVDMLETIARGGAQRKAGRKSKPKPKPKRRPKRTRSTAKRSTRRRKR